MKPLYKLVPWYILKLSELDHEEQTYEPEGDHLLIHCSGMYSIPELEEKLELLKEAEKLWKPKQQGKT
jgi:hypothetical protein